MRAFAVVVLLLSACDPGHTGAYHTDGGSAGDDDDGSGGDDAPVDAAIDSPTQIDAPISTALDCSTRPPPAGWTRRLSGQIQSYGSSDTDTSEMYLFNVADATKWANMLGFNDRIAPLNATVVTSGAPYVEKVGLPTPIIRPQFPGRPATDVMFGYGPHKEYYAMGFTMAPFPDASGATSLSTYYTGSSSNYGALSTISLSECPGDFNAALNNDSGTCLVTNFFGEGREISFESGLDPTSPGGSNKNICHLKPGVQYYLNVAPAKNNDWTQSSCAAGQWCWTTMIDDAQFCQGVPGYDCTGYITGH